MELIRGLHNLKPQHRHCVATIGNFDGVHLGHVKVLEQVKREAIKLKLPSTVILFEPQPREFFAGDTAPPRLTRFDEKVRLLQAQNINRVLCLNFNKTLRQMTADEFVKQLLLKGLQVRHLVVGDDFRFGCDRMGDFSMLQTAGQLHGFEVEHTDTHKVDGLRVSSTWIRETLMRGDFELARRLLGRPYSVIGRVQYGNQLGRQWGVPTANIRMHRFRSPLQGVYCVDAWVKEKQIPAICNIGVRPTLNGRQPILEVHLFDWQGDLYGQLLQVDFLHFMRPEKRFDSLDILKQQIYADIKAARKWFSQSTTKFLDEN